MESLRARVSNGCKGNDSYKEKGISVCERWNDFELFYLDMGPRPSDKHSIDRIDNSKDYFPENCRWTNQTVQCSNREILIKYLFTMENQKVLKAIAKDVGIGYTTLYSRIYVHGIPFEEAIIQKE